MNQQQLQAEETPTQIRVSSFAAPALSETENPALALETETRLEAESSAQEVGIADSYLLPLLQAEAIQCKRDGRNIFILCIGFLIGISLVVNRALVDGGHFLMFMALLYLLLIAIIGDLARRAYRRKRGLAAELAKPQAIDSVGALIDATRVENTQVRNLSQRALTGLLPQLKASDSGLLTDAHRDRLLRLLTISPNDRGYRDLSELFSRSAFRREVDVRVAILKAYEQIGGPKELPQVERLAKGQIHWQSAAKVPVEVQEAANECLPALQARAGEQRASEQLLRPSSGSAVPADILLRPADDRPDTMTEQLLRASESRIRIHSKAPK